MDIDMTAIRDAMGRRGMGGQGTPAIEQMTQPTGETPVGGPSTPVVAPPADVRPQGNAMMPIPARMRPQAPGANVTPGTGLDLETKGLAKQLVQKLLNVL